MLYLLIFALTVGQPEKEIQVYRNSTAPQIDGKIESIWTQADSATGFIQLSPYEGREASEPTTVWILQDDANLYVAFRCKTLDRKPMACLGGAEDAVTLYLDTFTKPQRIVLGLLHLVVIMMLWFWMMEEIWMSLGRAFGSVA